MHLDDFTSETVLWLVRVQTDLDCIRMAQCLTLENMKYLRAPQETKDFLFN